MHVLRGEVAVGAEIHAVEPHALAHPLGDVGLRVHAAMLGDAAAQATALSTGDLGAGPRLVCGALPDRLRGCRA